MGIKLSTGTTIFVFNSIKFVCYLLCLFVSRIMQKNYYLDFNKRWRIMWNGPRETLLNIGDLDKEAE